MELENITVALRPRTAREAIDLGAAMLRAHARAVWSAWFVFSLPIAVACIGAAWLLDMPWLGPLLIWWLLPLFDRVPLYVLSRAVFERAPSWRETLRGQRQWRWGSTLAAITWLRIDSHRALRLPMDLLEGLPRAQRRERWRVLRRPIGSDASILAFGCLELSVVLFASVFLFALLFIPRELMPDWLSDGPVPSGVRRSMALSGTLFASVAYLAWSVIEPLHVAAGFALYLNRRTQLEAWDVDLGFRRLRSRWLGAGRVAALLLALLAGMLSPHVWAQQAKDEPVRVEHVFDAPVSAEDKRFAEAAAEAYRDPRFGGERKERSWALRDRFQPEQPVVARGTVPLEGIGNGVAIGVKGVLVLLLIGLAVMIGLYVYRHARLPVIAPRERHEAKLQMHLETIETTEHLPGDLASATRRLWQGGRRREALALLYRGCVEQVSAALQAELPPDATEADCLRGARRLDDAQRQGRAVAIVRAWQYAAYADRYPRDEEFEQLLAGWPAQREGAA